MGESDGKSGVKRNSHHVYPKSRIPKRYRSRMLGAWIILRDVPVKAHNALHTIFGNRCPKEQADFLKKITSGRGVLDPHVYNAYKDYFDSLFGLPAKGDGLTLKIMLKVLRGWDLSDEDKTENAEKLADLNRILNKKIVGGIPLKKF